MKEKAFMKGKTMNKNRNEKRTTRVAAVITIVVLMTVSLLGTALAKYITEGNFGDSARVAYWGIGIDNELELFAAEYDGTVKSLNGENVVAPGTSGSTTIIIEEGVQGMPEVAFQLSMDDLEVTFDGWDEATIPINFTVNGTEVAKANGALKTAIEEIVGEYAVGDDLPELEIAWEWPFAGNDGNDTALGNNAFANTVSISATVTVEQID